MVEPDRERCHQVNHDAGAGGVVRDSLSSSYSGARETYQKKATGQWREARWNQESPESDHSPRLPV